MKHVPLPAPSDPRPTTYPPRCPTRWLDANQLQVDDLDDEERQTWKRNDDGFVLVRTEPLEKTHARTPHL